MSLIWIFTGVVLTSNGALQMRKKGEESKSDSPPPRGVGDFWPYLGLLLWLSYPWSYLKEDEIWQVLGLAKAASWLHSGLLGGTPSQNVVSTFKTVQFVAVLCTSPLTCRAKLACRQVELDIFVCVCVFFFSGQLLFQVRLHPPISGHEVRRAWLLPSPQHPGIGMWPSLANQSYLLATVIASGTVTWLTLGQGEPSLGLLKELWEKCSLFSLWWSSGMMWAWSQNVGRAFIMGESDMTTAKIRDGNRTLRMLFDD